MPILSRRRLQLCIDDLAKTAADEKIRDLIARLESKRLDQALPAEAELMLLWALLQLGDLEVEPYWWGDTRRPDAITEAIFQDEMAAIEIVAVDDNSMSGEKDMENICRQICEYANSLQRNFGDYLFFTFGYKFERSSRKRLAPSGYQLSESEKNYISNWIRKTLQILFT